MPEIKPRNIAKLDNIPDVNAGSPSDNDALTWDNATNKWIPEAVAGDVATDAIWDVKGDLAVGTGADTAQRLAVGTNDYVLTADSATTTGLKWAAVPGGAGATIELDNLGTVAINTSLISDADSTDDLGSSAKAWKGLYVDTIYFPVESATKFEGVNTFGGVKYRFWDNDASPKVFNLNILGSLEVSMSSDISGNKLVMGFNILPSSDSALDLGNSTKYWADTYTDKLYLNSTATLDGATAGHIKFVGDLVPASDDVEWIGEIGTPFKAIKGLVIKDTTDGKHYKVEVINGSLTATALD